MPYGGPPEDDLGPTQGIAGGPGPTPSGFDDGTPRPGETHAALPVAAAHPEPVEGGAAREPVEGGAARPPAKADPSAEPEGGGRKRDEPPEHVYDDPPEGKDPPPEHGA